MMNVQSRLAVLSMLVAVMVEAAAAAVGCGQLAASPAPDDPPAVVESTEGEPNSDVELDPAVDVEAACAPASEPVAAAADAGSGDAPEPVGCPHGYCEPDNRGALTLCRAGYHVGVYHVCGFGTDACCLPDP